MPSTGAEAPDNDVRSRSMLRAGEPARPAGSSRADDEQMPDLPAVGDDREDEVADAAKTLGVEIGDRATFRVPPVEEASLRSRTTAWIVSRRAVPGRIVLVLLHLAVLTQSADNSAIASSSVMSAPASPMAPRFLPG